MRVLLNNERGDKLLLDAVEVVLDSDTKTLDIYSSLNVYSIKVTKKNKSDLKDLMESALHKGYMDLTKYKVFSEDSFTEDGDVDYLSSVNNIAM